MEKEYGSTPKFVFSNSRMTQETRIANLIIDCFANEKGDEVRFNANSVRKFGKTRLRNADRAQPAHISSKLPTRKPPLQNNIDVSHYVFGLLDRPI